MTGSVWSILGFVGIWSGFVVGSIADRIGTRRTMLVCYFILLTGCLMMYFHSNDAVLIGAGIAYGLAYYPIYGLIPAYITKIYSTERSVFVFGIANIFLGLGGTLGNFLGGAAKTELGTFEYNYAISAVLCLALCILVLCLCRENNSSS